MSRFIVFTIFMSGILGSCQTTPPRSVPECDPNKVYAQPVPPVCRKAAPASCPKTKLLGQPYDSTDKASLNRATYRCAELFPVSPCLKVFSKVEDRKYRAICGAPSGSGVDEVIDWKLQRKNKNAK